MSLKVKLFETGLSKTCPRCRRVGKVLTQRNIGAHYVIVWGTTEKQNESKDTCLTLEDILDPVFGCGYCDRDRYRQKKVKP